VNRRVRIALAVAAVALAALPLFADRFWVQFAGKAMITCIFAASLDLLVGYGGMVSLAHAAFFGLSAYLLVGLSNGLGLSALSLTLPICLLGVALAAVAIGWLSLRTSGVYFVMVTLAFTEMLFHVFNEAPGLGGSDGMYLATRPIAQRTAVYFAIWIALVGVFVLLQRMVQAPFGRVLVGIRVNEPRMRTLGFATGRYKLTAFAIGAVVAGLAGYLDATLYGFVNPAELGWRQSGLVLVTVLLGGKGTLYGPMLGAVLLLLIEHFSAGVTEHWGALIGAVAIAAVLFLPSGLAGLLRGGGG
jgi:branched-chain amino acid transport system permease protein